MLNGHNNEIVYNFLFNELAPLTCSLNTFQFDFQLKDFFLLPFSGFCVLCTVWKLHLPVYPLCAEWIFFFRSKMFKIVPSRELSLLRRVDAPAHCIIYGKESQFDDSSYRSFINWSFCLIIRGVDFYVFKFEYFRGLKRNSKNHSYFV